MSKTVDLFQNLYLIDPIPEFASPDLLSRPLSEDTTVSWEKVLCKLSEALQDETLSQLLLLWVMLACRILMTLKKNESGKGLPTLNNRGKEFLTAVLPCLYFSNWVWLASSILLDTDLKKILSAMRPVLRSSPQQQAASKFVSAKWKRPIFESDEDDDKHSKSPPTKSKRKRCQLGGDQEAAVSDTKKCVTAADVGWSQLSSQWWECSAQICIWKVCLLVCWRRKSGSRRFQKNYDTVSKCLTATVKVAMSVNESESTHESGDDSDNDSGEGEKPCGIGKRNETGKPH